MFTRGMAFERSFEQTEYTPTSLPSQAALFAEVEETAGEESPHQG